MSGNNLLNRIENLDDNLKGKVNKYVDNLHEKNNKGSDMHPKAGFLKKNTFVVKEGFNDISDIFADYLP